MTIRKFVLTSAVAVLLAAAVSAAGIDWFGLGDFHVREDAAGWGWLGVALFAASSWPDPRLDQRWFSR